MTELHKPPGISNEELEELRTYRLAEIVSGEMQDIYDEWIMEGQKGEPYHPSVAIAIFPMFSAGADHHIVFVPQVASFVDDHEPIPVYWKRIKELTLPDRADVYEKAVFRELSTSGDEMLESYFPYQAVHLMPSAVVLFSRTDETKKTAAQESAYLFCPTAIPPSATHRHMILQTESELKKISTML